MPRHLPSLLLLVLLVPAAVAHGNVDAAPARVHAPAQPRLLFPGDDVAPKASAPEAAARELLERHAAELKIDGDAVDHLVLDAVHDIGRGGIIVGFRHREHDLEVWHDALKVLLARDTLKLIAISGQIHTAIPAAPTFTIGADDAVAAALRSLTRARVGAGDIHVDDDVDGAGYHKATSPLLRRARVKPVLAPVGDFTTAGYVVELSARVAGERFDDAVVVDAHDGRILQTVNLRHEAAFSYRVWAKAGEDHRPFDSPLGDTTPYPLPAPDGHYPSVVAPNLVTLDGFNVHADPWIADGAVESTGNNVDAFTDDANPDGFSPGDVRAHVTSPGVFDHTFDFTLDAEANNEQKQVAATALFYLVNWEHDWWYDSGFDEQSHNAQQSNYGRGGVEGDPLWAEAQDGAPDVRDNSDMISNDDGSSPEMQMFVWTGPQTASLAQGTTQLSFNEADFGPSTFNVNADVELAVDGTDPKSDACETVTNDLTGKIALVDRGNCEFVTKVNDVEAAGAIAVIIVDNDGTEGAPFVAGDPSVSPQPDIPIMSLSLQDGAALKASLLTSSVRMSMVRTQAPDIDGGLDTTVAAHEWGHYLHLRQVTCTSSMCSAQSEGWADFNAMMTTLHDGDDLSGAFAVGTFDVHAEPDDAAYFGIRRYPYSIDRAKNPLNLGDIADSAVLPADVPTATFNGGGPNSESHASGEVWCTMMFESLVDMLQKAKGTSAFAFDDTRRRMSDIVVAGMQLAPADPTYTEMRDAVLAGAMATDPADADTIAHAFASRGAGTCAVSPDRYSTDFEGVVEDGSVGANFTIDDIEIDDSVTSCDQDGLLDAGEAGHVTITVHNPTITALAGATITVSSSNPAMHFSSDTAVVGALAPFASARIVIGVSLDGSAATITHSQVKARVSIGPTCTPDGLTVKPLTNADDVDKGLATDSVEGTSTSWTPAGDFADQIWGRIESLPGADGGNVAAGNHVWSGFDAPITTDSSLVSPPLVVRNDTDLVITFKHRHDFEADSTSNYDGGVVEISVDAGAHWTDVASVKDPGYEGTIGDTSNQAHNVLKNRPGFVAKNPSFPSFDAISVNLGRSFASQLVQLRFRIGTDEGGGANGWELDDIGFTGIDNAPFSGLTLNKSPCASVVASEGEGEGPPVREGNGTLSVGPDVVGCGCGSTSSPVEWTALVVALMFLRRVRRPALGR